MSVSIGAVNGCSERRRPTTSAELSAVLSLNAAALPSTRAAVKCCRGEKQIHRAIRTSSSSPRLLKLLLSIIVFKPYVTWHVEWECTVIYGNGNILHLQLAHQCNGLQSVSLALC
ncbi:hypothetical protein F2P81_003780 [Scophthalmus maximus]|uniref:Uncharacterized protein n=1 Tax=Scophthalmus maximus TaxID=52904 RepID=A0A6A4TRH2_SCOMX|nr:hypothetical protein F2P81_003780 [Scophthalmus maximus]